MKKWSIKKKKKNLNVSQQFQNVTMPFLENSNNDT